MKLLWFKDHPKIKDRDKREADRLILFCRSLTTDLRPEAKIHA